MTDQERDEAEWFSQGIMDFHDGAVRVVPGIVFHYRKPVPIAQAWYRGWDRANIEAPVPA